MNEAVPGEPVTPHCDPDPDAHPGGIDAVHDDPDDFPVVTPDQPTSAQLEGSGTSDAVQEPEDKKQEGDRSDPSEDSSSDEPA